MRIVIILSLLLICARAKDVAYIHGDVAADGTIPSGAASPYDQMLLTDTGSTGCSKFRQMIEAEGYTISQHYDATTTLDAAFLDQFDVIVFGLHQNIWSIAERSALDLWIRAGGGIMMYSDSASGGRFNLVGIGNNTGQLAVNSILSAYGMQVAVDQGLGTRSYVAPADEGNPIVADSVDFEGEGVSPVAVDESTGARAIVPYEDANKTGGGGSAVNNASGITIANPRWAAIGHQSVGGGNVIAIFDRQPLWNNGPGSDIEERDNMEILRRIVRFLANDYRYPTHWLNLHFGYPRDPALQATQWGWNADADGDGLSTLEELAFGGDPLQGEGWIGPTSAVDPIGQQLRVRRWAGGERLSDTDYSARGVLYQIEHTRVLLDSSWESSDGSVSIFGPPEALSSGVEAQTFRLRSENFARLRLSIDLNLGPLQVNAGADRIIAMSGEAYLDGSVSGDGVTSTEWSMISGPGNVSFDAANTAITQASFTAPGVYELMLSANNGGADFNDTLQVEVFPDANVTAAINCGNNASYAGNNGFNYQADTFFTGGHSDQFPGNAVAGTDEDALYNYARSAHSAYRIPVANGDYLVLLQCTETFFTADNKRVFDASLEDQQIIDDLDLHASAPGKWVAYDRAFETTVSDGVLDLEFAASVNNPLVSGIVVLRR